MSAKIRGMESLRRKIAKLGNAPAPLRELALRSGAVLIQNEAKIRAPYLSGTLRRSIAVETETQGTSSRAVVGTNVPYAARQEFGFSGADRLGRHYNQAARPYMRPAWDQEKRNALEEIADTLRLLTRGL